MTSSALWLLGGLILLVRGGDLFVAAAVRVAVLLRMPNVVIGSTIVSLATTAPELVVAIMAGARGNSGLAAGNAVGSCVCNIGLILGITGTLKRVDIHPSALRMALFTMLGLAGALLAMTLDLTLQRWQGVILVMAGAAYFTYNLIDATRHREPAEVAEARAIKREATRGLAWFQTPAGTVTQFALGAGIVVFGSRLVVDGAVNLAGALGVPPLVIGLTVVAVGTSLPELVTAVGSARRKVSDLSVGNIIGANICNLSLIMGMAAALSPVKLDRQTQWFDFPAMVALMAILTWMLLKRGGLSRRGGVLLLLLYAGYIAVIVTLAVIGRRVNDGASPPGPGEHNRSSARIARGVPTAVAVRAPHHGVCRG